VQHVQRTLGVSERQACRAIDQPRSTQRYEPIEDDEERRLVCRMLELVREHPRFGYRRITALLRREGWAVNPKRVHRLWKREGLKVPKKQRKRRAIGGVKRTLHRTTHKDHVWAWDFIFDRTTSGRSLKWLSIVDEYTRECLTLEVGRHFRADDVLDVLRDLFVIRGVPQHIRSDNGPEFIAKAIQTWLTNSNVETLYIPPGAPWENGSAESFHSRLRDEFLNAEEFDNLAHARVLSTIWQLDYNHRRPHSALDYQTPAEFAATCVARNSAPARKPRLRSVAGHTRRHHQPHHFKLKPNQLS